MEGITRGEQDGKRRAPFQPWSRQPNRDGSVHVETGVVAGIRVATDCCPPFNGEWHLSQDSWRVVLNSRAIVYDVIPAHFKKYLPRLMQIIDCHGNRFILITKNIPRSSSCSLSAAWGLLHSSQRCMVDMVWRADHQGKWIHLQQNPLEWWSDPGGPRVHVNWRVCHCLQHNSSGTYIYEGKDTTWTQRHRRNQKPGSCMHTCWPKVVRRRGLCLLWRSWLGSMCAPPL